MGAFELAAAAGSEVSADGSSELHPSAAMERTDSVTKIRLSILQDILAEGLLAGEQIWTQPTKDNIAETASHYRPLSFPPPDTSPVIEL
jgi:hypothetical protein